MLYFLVAPFLPLIGQALGIILSFILSALNHSTAFIRDIPHSTTEPIWLSDIQILFYYLAVVLISGWLIKKNGLYLKLALGITIAFLLSDISMQYKKNDQKELLVYNIANSSVINYINGTNNLLFYDQTRKIKEEMSRYMEPYWLSKGVKTCKTYDLSLLKKKKEESFVAYQNFLCLNGIKIGYISNKDVLKKLNPQTKLELDYIILANDVNVSARELNSYFDFKMVILDSSNSYYHRKALSNEMAEKGIQFHSVHENGAFKSIVD